MVPPTDNPLLQLAYEPALESLGDDFYDVVPAADFPAHRLRWRNDALLPLLGIDPSRVSDADFVEAFGAFWGRSPLLALRYHGYQFGEYNPRLGDGRGFLYGQVRGRDGELYDLGTKGSGTTPYSRSADGRLTLKGGLREVLAAEALQAQGVRTSRCISLVETGEQLWRGDEPSPTRSSVMVRFSRSHIRFGSFERLHFLGRSDLLTQLLDHVIAVYYSHLQGEASAGLRFYGELVERVADLAAQWMVAGFCHGVLNTDNMSITGESFDYGPYAFIPTYDPKFTAAYFDYYGRYRYGNQPSICRLNLEMLQTPLAMVLPKAELEAALAGFEPRYRSTYRGLMLRRLGLGDANVQALEPELADDLVRWTVQLLEDSGAGYDDFFRRLRLGHGPTWREDLGQIPRSLFTPLAKPAEPEAGEPEANAETAPSSPALPDLPGWEQWRDRYHLCLKQVPQPEAIGPCLAAHNPLTPLLRPAIEAVWAAIVEGDDWQPFETLVAKLQRLA